VVAVQTTNGVTVSSDNRTEVTASIINDSGKGFTARVTVINGLATFSNLQFNYAPGGTLTFKAVNLTSASQAVAVSAAPPTQVQLVRAALDATGGAVFGQQPAVSLTDAYLNVAAGDQASTIVVSTSPSGALRGTTTVRVSGGVGQFTDLSIDTAGTYTLYFSSGSLAHCNHSLTVTVGPPAKISVTEQFPLGTNALVPFNFHAVTAVDAGGNLIQSYPAPMSVVAVGAGQLTGNTTAMLEGGRALFSSMSYDKVGNVSLTFSLGTASFTRWLWVKPGRPVKLIIVRPAARAAQGGAMGVQPIIAVADGANNTVTSDLTSVVSVTATSQNANGFLFGADPVTVVEGVATWSGLGYTRAGVITLAFTAVNFTGAQQTLEINLAHLSIVTAAAGASGGSVFTTQPVVAVHNVSEVVQTDIVTTVTVSGSHNGNLTGTRAVQTSAGVATFSGLKYYLAGPTVLTYTAPSMTDASQNLTVVVGPASFFAIRTSAAGAFEGRPFLTQPVLWFGDNGGNMVTTGSFVVSVTASGASGNLIGSTSATAVNGVAAFSGLGFTGLGTVTLTFSVQGLTSRSDMVVVASGCGDGVKVATEACDDGNLVDNDGCSKTCTIESGWTCSGTNRSTCTPVCGDGKKLGNEACDDGNQSNNDGCSSTCTIEAGWTCTGAAGAVTTCTAVCGDGKVVGQEQCDDSNTAANDGCSATCTIESGWTCPATGGACTAKCGEGTRRGNEQCDDGNTNNDDGCSATCTIEAGWTCTGAVGAQSTCNPVCGNGVKTGNEQCDDGNTSPGDGCSATCTVEAGWNCPSTGGACTPQCGDGRKLGNEQCDDGNTNNNDGCSSTCTTEAGWTCTGATGTKSTCTGTCGDGKKVGNEQCDDGNSSPGDGCSAACAVESGWSCPAAGGACTPKCGDGLKVGNEQCDDGNTNNNDGCSSTCTTEAGWTCTGATGATSSCASVCGDGKKVGSEQCDDGNSSPGDGCSASCAVETGFKCAGDAGARSTCSVICGDGITIGGEACDDGNTNSGDGCSNNCVIEGGWTCQSPTGGRTTCTATCGDGSRKASQACDDGNKNGGDGCSATCSIEAGWKCTGDVNARSTCVPVCGDGIQTGSEACDDGNTKSDDGCKADCSATELGWSCTTVPGGKTTCTVKCGDGLKMAVEGCDDGNVVAGDGCSAECTVERGYACDGSPTSKSTCETGCGDGIVKGKEQCDDGNFADNDGCSAACAVEQGWDCTGSSPSVCKSKCGDGKKVGSEACDDGNLNAGDGCSATCTVEPGWTCEGPNGATICGGICGDSLRVGQEACDDGNTKDGDGCSATCGVEDGWTCSVPASGGASVCVATCGDGKKVGAEACDDGNKNAGDGCSPTCAVEDGWNCKGSPSVCGGLCGDGKLVGGEVCDDGNTKSGDGCSAACAVEANWQCDTAAPSTCKCAGNWKGPRCDCDNSLTCSDKGFCRAIDGGCTCNVRYFGADCKIYVAPLRTVEKAAAVDVSTSIGLSADKNSNGAEEAALVVPAGALKTATSIAIDEFKFNSTLMGGKFGQAPEVLGTVKDFQPSGLVFEEPVDLTLAFPIPDDIATTKDEFLVHWLNPQTAEWDEIVSTFDKKTGTSSCKINHFSYYAVLRTAPKPVVSAPSGGDGGSSGLSPGAIAGIVIGVLAVAGLAVGLALFVFMKRQNRARFPLGEKASHTLHQGDVELLGGNRSLSPDVESPPPSARSNATADGHSPLLNENTTATPHTPPGPQPSHIDAASPPQLADDSEDVMFTC